jgi:hypothetical protein
VTSGAKAGNTAFADGMNATHPRSSSNALAASMLCCLALLAAAAPFTACAQDVSFSVSPDRTSAMLGERIQVTAQIVSNKQLSGSFAPQIPKSDDFDMLGMNQNSSQSTSIQVVNGKMTQNVTITYFFYYQIAPKKPGSFTFPALKTVIDGKTYASNPFVVSVGKEAAQATTEVHVVLSVTKKNLYLGEQTFLTVKVAQKSGAQVQLSQQGLFSLYDKLEKSLSKDFAVARLFTQLPSKGDMEVVNGEKEFVVKVQYALFPISTGDLSILPVPFEYVSLKRVQSRRGSDPFSDFFPDEFFGSGVQQVGKSVLSNGLTIHSSLLPPAPAGFSGAVGSFTMNVGADPRTVPSGEAVTLSIGIRGSTRPGSMGDISMPQLPECEVFAPEKHVSVDTTQNGLTCQKGYKYLVIPRQEGRLVVPPLSWVYFDPSAQVYKTLKSDTIVITVTKGKTTQAGQTRYLTQEEIRQVGQDIRYIKTGISIGKQTDSPYRNPLFLILFPIPFLIATFSLLYRMQAQRYEKDASLALRLRASRRAFRTLAGLKKNAAAMPAADFLGNVSVCLENFVTHKFGFAATGRTLDELRSSLLERHVSTEVIERLAGLLESTDTFRFGMRSLDASSRSGILEQAAGLIRDLERQKRGKS